MNRNKKIPSAYNLEFFMVALGFEPRLEDSKSSVLTATLCDRLKKFFLFNYI